jgi:hypothetical protein
LNLQRRNPIIHRYRRKCCTIDSLLAIIGPAGTDIKGIAENYSAGSASSTAATEETTSAPADVATPVIKKLQLMDNEF